MAQTSLKLTIFLTLIPKCWDNKCESPYLVKCGCFYCLLSVSSNLPVLLKQNKGLER